MKSTTILQFIAVIIVFVISGCWDNNGDVIEASGTLEAVEVNIASKMSGQLLVMKIREGSSVERGDTIALIDHAMQSIQLQHADAGIDLARSQYDLLRNGARSEDLRSAEEVVRQAESGYLSAKADFDRVKELFASHAVSKKQYEDAESRHTITLAQYNAARQNLQKLRQFARPEEISAAKARMDQAIAQANLIRKQISDSYIVSPVKGTVTYKPVEEGELVNPGTIVVRLSQLERMELMIYVKETDLGKVKLGSQAEVFIDTYPEKKYPATVIYISPVAEFTPRNVQTKDERTKLVYGVKLEVENSSGDLKSGMPADALLR